MWYLSNKYLLSFTFLIVHYCELAYGFCETLAGEAVRELPPYATYKRTCIILLRAHISEIFCQIGNIFPKMINGICLSLSLAVSFGNDLDDPVFDGVGLGDFKSRSNAFLLA